MSGISGVVSARGRVDRDRLASMSATLAHRGPDSEGTFAKGPVGLAARQLASADPEEAHQPIASEDGKCVAVLDGAIYNRPELARELGRGGHTFRTPSDTEVLVHAYEEWGPRFAERLRGMFAIAIWDARHKRLVLARDRFGIKPLSYRHVEGGELSFASELDALPAGELDLGALEAFLAFGSIPAPLSIFREIRKLPAGHVLFWKAGQIELERYARPGPLAARRGEDEAELVEECRARLRDSVRAHLPDGVPVGVLLSGGVGSSALVALAAQEQREAVRTFSIGFEQAPSDELACARAVASRYGTQHRALVLRPAAALLLPALAEAFDEPFADASALPTYVVSRLAAEDVKIAFSGVGGRDLFGGDTDVADLAAERAGTLAVRARPLVERLPSSARRTSLGSAVGQLVRTAHLPPLERHHGWRQLFSSDARAELTGRWQAWDPVDLLRERFAETEGHELPARLQDVDLGIHLADGLLVATDRASMASSLEARVPFVDPVVASFALSLPARLDVRGLSKRRLVRRAVEPLLPRQLGHGRRRIRPVPTEAWLRAGLESFARETLSAETLRRQGYFDPAAVARLLEDHVAGREDHSRRLWGLLAFTLWHERHVEGVARDAAIGQLVAG